MINRTDIWAVIIGAGLLTGYVQYQKAAHEAAPATDWFTVREVNIPNFVEGQNPIIVYDRTIKKDFFGTFVVEIHKAEPGVNYAVCSNSASRTYKAGEKPPETVDLKWFVDRDCGLKSGQYVAETTWKIEAEGYPDKEYSAVSNVFQVLPAGSQTYITPKQIDQLEKAQELLNESEPQ